MGKKKKRNRQTKTAHKTQQHTTVTSKEAPEWLQKMRSNTMAQAAQVTPEQQAKAVERLKQLFMALSNKPESVLEMLERLKIPYQVIDFENWCSDRPLEGKHIVFSADCLEQGEERNENLLKRIYKDNTAIVPVEPTNTESVSTPTESVNTPTESVSVPEPLEFKFEPVLAETEGEPDDLA